MSTARDRVRRGMAGHEPASGPNLPPGCFDSDIERAFGGDRRRCRECMHCIVSDELDRLFCAPRLADAVAGPGGARRLSPERILAAVEDASVCEDDCCAGFEG